MEENSTPDINEGHSKTSHLSSVKLPNLNIFRNKKTISLALIALAIPLTIVLALTQQDFFNHAAGPDIASVAINPGSINMQVDQKQAMSTLAYDSQGNPVFSGVSYQWSMSSINSVGTLSKTDGEISEFTGLNAGCGELTVIARKDTQTITKSISVAVSDGSLIPDCSSATPSPTLTPTPTPSPSPVPSQKKIIFNPTDDAYVIADTPKNNFGGVARLNVDSSPKTDSYLKFNLNPLAGKKIISAVLKLRVSNNAESASTGKQSIRQVANTTWSQSTINYSNRPAVGKTLSSINGGGPGSDVNFDVTSWASERAGLIGSLNITSSSSDSLILNSKEATGPHPQLMVTYTD